MHLLILRPHGKQADLCRPDVRFTTGGLEEWTPRMEVARSVGMVVQRLQEGAIYRLHQVTGNPRSPQRGALDVAAGVMYGVSAQLPKLL